MCPGSWAEDEDSESAYEARPEVQGSSSKDGWVVVSRKSRRRSARSGDSEHNALKEEEEQVHIFVKTSTKTVP